MVITRLLPLCCDSASYSVLALELGFFSFMDKLWGSSSHRMPGRLSRPARTCGVAEEKTMESVARPRVPVNGPSVKWRIK